MILNHKVICDDGISSLMTGRATLGGGGGSSSFAAIKRPTQTEKPYAATKAIYLRRHPDTHDLVFDVVKDRHASYGEKTLSGAIEFVAKMIIEYKFNGSNEMFQESEALRLIEVMNEVLMGDDCIPSEEAIKEYGRK